MGKKICGKGVDKFKILTILDKSKRSLKNIGQDLDNF